MDNGRSFRRGAALAAIAAIIVAVVATLPSAGVATAQSAWCLDHPGRCDINGAAGVWCNGFFDVGATSCTAMASTGGVWCNGAFEPGMAVCPGVTAAGGVWCNGSFEPGMAACPDLTAAGVWCNGSFEPGMANCPEVTAVAAEGGVWCNGAWEAGASVCPASVAFSAGVTCNGGFFSGQSFCPSTTFTGIAPAIGTAVAGEPVTFNPGWDIVAGPAGTVITGNVGPMYAFGPGSTTYTVVPQGTPLQAGMGYWAYFEAPASTSLAFTSAGASEAALPPGQFVLIGNPGDTVATVSGASMVLTWNGSQYTQVSQLNPGQGAWAFSWAGVQAAIIPSPI